MAESHEHGIYARGASEHFEWYAERIEHARKGGLKSAENRRAKSGTAVPKNARNAPNPTEPNSFEETEAGAEGPPEVAPKHLPKPITTTTVITKTSTKSSPRQLAELWNELKADVQPAVRVCSLKPGQKRFAAAKARLSEQPELDYWRDVIGRLAASPFCCGDGERGWTADFDFLVRPDTHVRALEGKYDGKAKPRAEPIKISTLQDIIDAEGGRTDQ